MNAIELNLVLEDYTEVEDWFNFLDEFFKKLIVLIPELNDYGIRSVSNETSLMGDNFMFYGYLTIAKILSSYKDWEQRLPLVLKLDVNKDSSIWFGKVTKKLKNEGYGIINNTQSRQAFINRIEKEFKKLM